MQHYSLKKSAITIIYSLEKSAITIIYSLEKSEPKQYYFSKDSGLKIDFVSTLFNKPYLVEVKAKSGKAKAARNVIDNPNYKVSNLLKLTSQNIGITEDTITAPYYLSLYLLNK